jgi:hypothetical protein
MKTITTLLTFTLIILTVLTSNAQSLRGKVIYISPSQEVKLKFRSAIASYSFMNKNEANHFKLTSRNKKNLLINSIGATSKSAYLTITEGENTHLFILAYIGRVEAASEVVYDYSTKEKLEFELHSMSLASIAPPPQKNTFVKNAVSTSTSITPVTQAVNKIEPRPEQTEIKEPPADAGQIKEQPSQPKNVNASAITNKTPPITNNASVTLSTQTSLPAETTFGNERSKQIADSINYERFIHFGDSTAWIVKDYKSALKWYDSAQKISPQAAFPRKQAKVVKQLQLEKETLEANKTRDINFNNALVHYKKGDASRLERNYAASYKEFGEFLTLVDTTNLNSYMSSQLYYINQAKDYRQRLLIHLPKEEPVIVPATNDKKKKKRKG